MDPLRAIGSRLGRLLESFATPTELDPLPEPDPAVVEATHTVVSPICDRYFRGEVRGLERVPDRQVMLVGHHDGGLYPVGGLCLGVAWHRRLGLARPLRGLMHEIPFHVAPALTRWLHGIGVVPASPGNLERLLDRGQDVLLYPGAAREAFRPYHRRREVDLGGRRGFVTRALRRGLPVVPVASAGAHEIFFVLRRGGRFARWSGIYRTLRADVWPVAMGLPWGIWVGPNVPFLPLPAKITVEVLPPLDLAAAIGERLGRTVGPADAEDRAVVDTGYALVRTAMADAVGRLYDARRFPVLG